MEAFIIFWIMLNVGLSHDPVFMDQPNVVVLSAEYPASNHNYNKTYSPE